jgi:hypothetical protein
MAQKIRILTYHHLTNNGAFLFVYSLMRLLQAESTSSAVKVLDYKTPRLALVEYLKRFKVFQGIPLFYMKRSKLWEPFLKGHLDLDSDFPHLIGEKKLQGYLAKHCSALIVGMDVWCLTRGAERPGFPNIYWLTEKMAIPKIAYGISAYKSDRSLIQAYRDELRNYLNDFDVIGTRDRFTHEMVLEHRTRSTGLVEKVSDPTFSCEIPPTDVRDKLTALGVDLDRPLLGILLFGENTLSQAIQSHFRSKGYQVLALSMYNPFADFNLGHVLNPFEWAGVFRHLSFCLTDRYHGTIFCIKNQIPFLTLEKERNLPQAQSKLYDLLNELELPMCYINTQAEGFEIHSFLGYAEEIEKAWQGSIKPALPAKILAVQTGHRQFIQKMKAELAW